MHDLSDLAPTAALVARILMGGVYSVAGVEHFMALTPLTGVLAGRGVPLPRLSLIAASLFQIVAGLAVVVGVLQAWAAVGLIAFTILSSVVMVDFWNKRGDERAVALQTWQSNIALIGGLLAVAALDGG